MLSVLAAIGLLESARHTDRKLLPQLRVMPSSQEEFSLDEQFEAAVDIVQAMPKEGPVTTSNDEKLAFYSLFKQATLGPCTGSRPAIWNVIERFKWDAWKTLGDMDSQEAKRIYVKKMQRKIDDVSERFNFAEWLCGDDYDRLEPVLRRKFKAIGRELLKAGEEKGGDSEALRTKMRKNDTEEEKGNTKEKNESTPASATNTESAAALSDCEYCDAVEESESRASSFLDRPQRADVLVPEMQTLASHLVRVAAAVERLADFVTKNTGVKPMSSSAITHQAPRSFFRRLLLWLRTNHWKTLVFILVWPFFATYLMRYFGW